MTPDQQRFYPPPSPVPPAPPAPPEPYRLGFGQLTRQVQSVLVLALVVTAVFAACLGLGVNYVLTAQHQHGQYAEQIKNLAKANTGLAKLIQQQHQANGKTSGDLSGFEKAVAPYLSFSGVCSQDFTGPNGPAEYQFPCQPSKPASSSTG